MPAVELTDMPRRVRALVGRHPVPAFFALTYLLSWTAWAPLVASGAPPGLRTTLLILVGGFGPAVAAAVVTWAAGDGVRAWASQLLHWRVGARWWAVALLLPAATVTTAGALAVLAFGRPFAPESLGAAATYPLTMTFVFLAGGGNEEPGWRGFALPRLQARFSALAASLVVGVGWVVWHLPLFAIPGSAQAGLPLHFYAVAVLAESVVFTWLYNGSGGSVLLAMTLHASVNNATVFYLAGGSAAISTPLAYGLFTAVIVAVALAIVWYHGPERLASGEVPRGPPGVDG